MKPFFVKLHSWTDFLLPYTLILLIFIIIVEFFFVAYYASHHLFFEVLDWIIISIFAVDLGFKFHRSKTFPIFLKTSWLDILATIPFFMVFRIMEGIGALSRVADVTGDAQHVVSASLEASREVKALHKAELAIKEGSRSERFLRFLRPIMRTPRLLKAVHFFEHPKHKIKH